MSERLDYEPQLNRIRQKLPQARAADPGLEAFSAETHKYVLYPPAKQDEVDACEQRLGVSFPPDFKAFLLGVGHGGASFQGAGAGPFYGIYHLDFLGKYVLEGALTNPAVLFPHMSDEAFEAAKANLYDGLVPICDQGCGNESALVMNGPHRGRVVDLPAEGMKPQFACETNFLDWYERWLDEVISGTAL